MDVPRRDWQVGQVRLVRFLMLLLAGGGFLAGRQARAGLLFNFLPDPGTPQYVVDGFTLAANRWSAVLANDITVNIAIGYLPLGSGILGDTGIEQVQQPYASVVAALNLSSTSAEDASAYSYLQNGPTYSRLVNHTSDNPNGPNSATPYVNSLSPVTMTRANAKTLNLLPASSEIDAAIHFNSALPFDFDPSNGVMAGQYDFTTMAAHEIGHALGFISGVDDIERAAGANPASQLPSSILDLFRFSAESLTAGTGFIDTTADGRNKYFSVAGGTTALTPFASGALYGTGSQASHWKEFLFAGYLMDPQLFPGIQRQISNTDLRAFDVIGYTRTDVPEPGSGALLALGLLLWRGWSAGLRSGALGVVFRARARDENRCVNCSGGR